MNLQIQYHCEVSLPQIQNNLETVAQMWDFLGFLQLK